MKPSEKLIQAIVEKELKPVPKWRFTLRNGLLLGAFLIAVLLGALAFSVILYAIQEADFNVLSHLTHSRLEMFLGLLPIFWIVILVIFLVIAIYSVQYSPRGYKFTAAKLVGYSAALSILMGTLFFIAGGAHRIENAFAVNVGIYESIQDKKIELWSMPAEGYLSGEIQDVEMGTLQLKDFQGNKWIVHFENANIRPAVLLERNETIKLIGEQTGEGEFSASDIRPWGARGRGSGQGRGRKGR